MRGREGGRRGRERRERERERERKGERINSLTQACIQLYHTLNIRIRVSSIDTTNIHVVAYAHIQEAATYMYMHIHSRTKGESIE